MNVDTSQEEFTDFAFLNQEIPSTFKEDLTKKGYTVVKRLGEGKYGYVLLVNNESFHQLLAMKVEKSKGSSKINHEYGLLKSFDHPNIVNIYSKFSIEENECLMIEYCAGRNLFEKIRKHGYLKPPRLYSYCYQLISAVWYLHQHSIAHGDIKLENILVKSEKIIKLTDFGISCNLNSKDELRHGGTGIYVGPEIWERVEDYNPFQADVFALGVTMYLMAEGVNPWGTKDLKQLSKLIPQGKYRKPQNGSSEFRHILYSMLNTDPSKRVSIEDLKNNSLFQPKEELPKSNSGEIPQYNRLFTPSTQNRLKHFQNNNVSLYTAFAELTHL